jgi:hypothetical protein
VTTLEANQAKKWMRCLKCGVAVWTDRCHRICRACSRDNRACPPPVTTTAVSVDPREDDAAAMADAIRSLTR